MQHPYTGLDRQYFETAFLYECIEELKKKALLVNAGLYEMTPTDKLAFACLKKTTSYSLDWAKRQSAEANPGDTASQIRDCAP
jgi:hypothetical protein